MENSRPKRPKAPPPKLDLEEMEQHHSMRGMLSFLEISPEEKLEMLRRRAQVEATETTNPDTVALDPAASISIESSITISNPVESTVATVPAATGIDTPPAPVVPGLLWCAEGNAGVFPDSRVRRIVRARDALTRTEQTVYGILWDSGSAEGQDRLSSAGYDVLARQAGVTKMNAKHILERLIDKGFLKVDALADPLRRIPTRYRVFAESAAIEHMTRRNRTHVVRTGNGLLFVHPATVVVAT